MRIRIITIKREPKLISDVSYAMQCDAIVSVSAMQCDAIQCDAMQSYAMQCHLYNDTDYI